MKRMTQNALSCAALLFVLLVPSLARGESVPQCPSGEGPRQFSRRNVMRELNLTAEQSEQLKAEKQASRQKRQELQDQIRAKRQELRKELDKNVIDRNAVNTLIGQLKDLQGSLLNLRVDSILSMKQILTPEQFEKLRSLRQEKAEKGPQEKRDRQEGRGGWGKKSHSSREQEFED